MNNKVYIGIDNGPSGTIGVIEPDRSFIMEVPTKIRQDYTKKKQNITRLDFDAFCGLLDQYPYCSVGIERPMVNPQRFQATKTALRFWEAQLIAFEHLKVPYVILDSKTWQKKFFPNKFASNQTKELSNQYGKQLFPEVENPFKDYDGLLIALWMKLSGY